MTRTCVALLAIIAWSAAASATCALNSRQEAGPDDPDDSKLRIRINLTLGNTTLEKVAAEVTRQTGLTIEAVDYLGERRLTIAMEGMSARDALDALAEMHDWTWYRTSPGHYLLTRHTLRLPRDPAGMMRAVPLALPPDWRRYFRVGLPAKEAVRLPPAQGFQFPDDPKMPIFLRAKRGVDQQAASLVEREKLRLYNALKQDVAKSEKVPYAKLPAEEQRRLVFILTMRHIIYTDFRLLFNEMPFYARDLSTASVSLLKTRTGISITFGGIIVGPDGVAKHSISFGTGFDPTTGK